MTSDVMVTMTFRRHLPRMMKKLLPLVTLTAFTAYSVWVVAHHGYFGFVSLALREPWGMQMLLDLCISFFMISTWLRRDAREQGITAWPYLAGIVVLGSIGALAYLVRRGFAQKRRAPSTGLVLGAFP